jgi:hypothetical protein
MHCWKNGVAHAMLWLQGQGHSVSGLVLREVDQYFTTKQHCESVSDPFDVNTGEDTDNE